MICRTLHEFLTNIRIDDFDMQEFKKGINKFGDRKIKTVVLNMLDSFKDERKNNTSPLSTKQKDEL